MRPVLLLCLLTSLLCPVTGQETATSWRSLQLPQGGELSYGVHHPEGWDGTRPRPTALVFADGARERAAVREFLAAPWVRRARQEGWVLVLPAEPAAGRFHEGGGPHLAALLRELHIRMAIAGQRLHLVGCGEGGHSAFRAALRHPFAFASLTVKGSVGLAAPDLRRLPRLRGIRVRLTVPRDRQQPGGAPGHLLERLQDAGVEAALSQGPEPIRAALLSHAAATAAPPGVEGEVATALDAWHDAAAKGDAERYFGAFAPEGVFLGTDPDERWTAAALKAWAAPYFQRESAWIFVPVSRNVALAPDGEVAWFDEVLGSFHYGTCRGTGVMRRVGDSWKVAHYSLTVPVPNPLMRGVVAGIQRLRDAQEQGMAAEEAMKPVTLYLILSGPTPDGGGLTSSGQARAEALSRLLSTADLQAVMTTDAPGAQGMAAPAAHQAGLEMEAVPTVPPGRFQRRIRRLPPGSAALVAGEEPLLTALLQDLGAPVAPGLPEDAAESLLVTTLDAAGRAHLQQLRLPGDT